MDSHNACYDLFNNVHPERTSKLVNKFKETGPVKDTTRTGRPKLATNVNVSQFCFVVFL